MANRAETQNVALEWQQFLTIIVFGCWFFFAQERNIFVFYLLLAKESKCFLLKEKTVTMERWGPRQEGSSSWHKSSEKAL